MNGFGVQGDSILNSQDGGRGGHGGGPRGVRGIPRGDISWNALFVTAGRFVEDGFTAEMAIPYKSLRYPQRSGDAPHRWGFQIARTIGGKDEIVVWSPTSRAVAGFLPQMGVLDGLTGLSTSRNMEILPTFTAVQFGSLDTSTGAFVNKNPSPEGGVNFKYGVTSNLIADLTFNPDFSQIESDRPQIEVNERFALFFPELRPFFLEGAEIFLCRGRQSPRYTPARSSTHATERSLAGRPETRRSASCTPTIRPPETWRTTTTPRSIRRREPLWVASATIFMPSPMSASWSPTASSSIATVG